MVTTLLLTVLIIAIAMILLCVNVILKKDGQFPSMHIHDSEAMKQRNIHCVVDQDHEAQEKGRFF